jgi:predicted XRE-type DNA-binding protein
VKRESNKPAHITRGNVLDDLGFPRSEAAALKMKAILLNAILHEIEKQSYSESELAEILDEFPVPVRDLVKGRINKLSFEKLLAYSDRLKMETHLTVRATASEPVRVNGDAVHPRP